MNTAGKRYSDISSIPDTVVSRMASGKIRALLPTSVIREGEKVTGVFSTDGFIPVSESVFSAVNILELTGRILNMADELKDNLIDPGEIVFDDDLIFIDHKSRKTRMVIMPDEKAMCEKDRINGLILSLKRFTDERGGKYLDVFSETYLKKKYSLSGYLTFIEDLKREAGME